MICIADFMTSKFEKVDVWTMHVFANPVTYTVHYKSLNSVSNFMHLQLINYLNFLQLFHITITLQSINCLIELIAPLPLI